MQLPAHFVAVDIARLSAGALQGIVEEIVTRDGTDYGHHEVSVGHKRQALLDQLRRGEALLVFNLETDTASVVRPEDMQKSPGS